ncbi:MAG: hypothetical protein Q7R96_01735 [Nanoarchaeota archaeon]|nr:hypothetical protein [Nanoarchaeota archaeon]
MQRRVLLGTFEQTNEFQRKLEALITLLEQHGTLVNLAEDREKDADTFPYQFFRKCGREYIFPQQEVSPAKNDVSYASKGTPYQITYTEKTWTFDAGKIQGKLVLFYRDADNSPVLTLNDRLPSSILPAALEQGIASFFKE